MTLCSKNKWKSPSERESRRNTNERKRKEIRQPTQSDPSENKRRTKQWKVASSHLVIKVEQNMIWQIAVVLLAKFTLWDAIRHRSPYAHSVQVLRLLLHSPADARTLLWWTINHEFKQVINQTQTADKKWQFVERGIERGGATRGASERLLFYTGLSLAAKLTISLALTL